MTERRDHPARRAEEKKEVLVAVMGATGAGKSSFINLILGSNLEVGDGLRSCTKGIEVSSSFSIDDATVTLIDTPGFDDTNMSDTEVLTLISLVLAGLYGQGQFFSGILFFHRISDVRMGGTSRRNFNMFRHLCGDEFLRNVVIVTNMWGEVSETQGKARLQELSSDELFFKPALQHGARIVAHDRTTASAQSILREVCRNQPMALRIQRELVVEGKNITETEAGMALDEELTAQLKKYQQELQELQSEMEEAMQESNEEAIAELRAAQQALEGNVTRIYNERQGLVSGFTQGKATMITEIEAVKQELAAERAAKAKTSADIIRLRREGERMNRHNQERLDRTRLLVAEEQQRQQVRDGIVNRLIMRVTAVARRVFLNL